MARKIVLILLLCCATAFAKWRYWQDAIVIDIGSSNGGAVAVPIGTMAVALPITYTHYIVETKDLKLDLATDHSFSITLNKKTHIAIDGNNAYLLDDSGHERKLRIIAKAALKKDTL